MQSAISKKLEWLQTKRKRPYNSSAIFIVPDKEASIFSKRRVISVGKMVFE
jgi:hypothetical protein